jgi:hypothetical protein
MHKTLRAASLTLGSLALAGACTSANAAWILGNDNGGDGRLSGAFPAFTLTGSDNGGDPAAGGFDNTTFYTQTFAAAATLTFSWQYASADTGSTAFDPAGWVLDDVETQLSVNGPAGTPSGGTGTVSVNAGDTFGFYVYSLDSLYGAGMLAINEDLPPPPAIPEPQDAVLLAAGLVALLALAKRRQDG